MSILKNASIRGTECIVSTNVRKAWRKSMTMRQKSVYPPFLWLNSRTITTRWIFTVQTRTEYVVHCMRSGAIGNMRGRLIYMYGGKGGALRGKR